MREMKYHWNKALVWIHFFFLYKNLPNLYPQPSHHIIRNNVWTARFKENAISGSLCAFNKYRGEFFTIFLLFQFFVADLGWCIQDLYSLNARSAHQCGEYFYEWQEMNLTKTKMKAQKTVLCSKFRPLFRIHFFWAVFVFSPCLLPRTTKRPVRSTLSLILSAGRWKLSSADRKSVV